MKQIRRKTLAIAAAAVLVAGAAVLFVTRKATVAPAASSASTQASALTVELVAPELRTWPQEVHASGALAAWEEMVLSPETGGLRVAELMVNVGQQVSRGQLLARLGDDTVRAELAKQQALVAQAEATLLQAQGNLRRAQAVDVAGALSPLKMDEYKATEATSRASLASVQADLRSAQLKLAQTRIVAPDAGIVSSKSGVIGNVVSAGTELYRLIRQGRVEWRAELDARQLTQVRAGQSARVQAPGGQALIGRVRLVSPTVSTTTGRGFAYVDLPAGSAARAGVFASGTISLDQQPALTLPESAVVLRDGRSYVYVISASGKAASRPVSVGRRQVDRVEIVSGLDAGARVVAKGGAFRSEGAQVTVASAEKAAK